MLNVNALFHLTITDLFANYGRVIWLKIIMDVQIGCPCLKFSKIMYSLPLASTILERGYR